MADTRIYSIVIAGDKKQKEQFLSAVAFDKSILNVMILNNVNGNVKVTITNTPDNITTFSRSFFTQCDAIIVFENENFKVNNLPSGFKNKTNIFNPSEDKPMNFIETLVAVKYPMVKPTEAVQEKEKGNQEKKEDSSLLGKFSKFVSNLSKKPNSSDQFQDPRPGSGPSNNFSIN